MSFTPASIYDDAEYVIVVTVSNIGNIQVPTDLIVTCSTSAICRCSVAQFSLSFASLNCAVKSTFGTIAFNVSNNNSAGFGVAVTKNLQVLRATSPRFVTASATMFTSLGRSPIAIAVANVDSIDDIKVAGSSIGASNIMVLKVVQPFDSKRLDELQTQVKTIYVAEPIFSSAFYSVASNFISNFAFNATIFLFRMPLNAN